MNMKRISAILLFAVVFYIIGELDCRFFSHEKQMEYAVDDELYFRTQPNQTAYEWMGQLSFKSPPIHLNSLGLRNPEIDLSNKSKYRILATGSSLTFGSGVKDSEVWSEVLQNKLNDSYKTAKYEVLNGANPGWGPFQYSILLKRLTPVLRPDLILAIYTPADVRYLPIQDKGKETKYLRDAKIRKKMISLSPFVTYCYRKLDLYITRFKYALRGRKSSSAQEDSVETIAPFSEKQVRYFKKIGELAKTNKIPVMIAVCALDKPQQGKFLYESLLDLKKTNPFFHCSYLGPEIFGEKKFEQMIIPRDGHLNKEGNSMLAEAVFECLNNFIEK